MRRGWGGEKGDLRFMTKLVHLLSIEEQVDIIGQYMDYFLPCRNHLPPPMPLYPFSALRMMASTKVWRCLCQSRSVFYKKECHLFLLVVVVYLGQLLQGIGIVVMQ